MIIRNLSVAITAIGLATSPTTVSYAEEGLGVGTQLAGAIVAVTQLAGITGPQADDDRVGTTELVGKCTYVGVTTLNGQIQFTYGGSVESYSTDPTRQPQATQARCCIYSHVQPIPGSHVTFWACTSIALAGAVAPTPPALTPPLQLRPVEICVDGFGVYGPNTEGNPKFLVQTCSTNAL